MRRVLFFATCAMMMCTGASMAKKACGIGDVGSCASPQKGVNYSDFGVDWNLTCDIYNEQGRLLDVPVSGIAMCVSPMILEGDLDNLSSVLFEDSVADNRICVCKVTSPVVTSWVAPFARSVQTSSDNGVSCMQSCSKYCVYLLNGYKEYVFGHQISD